ncbi:MAG: hypothetical protein ACOC44_19690 [Promethearchaeia archaeon]
MGTSSQIKVAVANDLQRRILEVLSLIRVIDNYYDKKAEIQKKIKPILFKQFRDGLQTLKNKKDWLFSIPSALDKLSEDFAKRKDSFRFPDSIILFEVWMNLELQALFPRYVLHFKFPGLLKGEKTRNVFQFIYATSRGFGLPIYFGPEFYQYYLTVGKTLEPLFRWSHTVCHRINQLVYWVADKKIKFKRHHPGEFESVIISEYEDNVYKGIDTLLHGYYTNDPSFLGVFSSLWGCLDTVVFNYTIGDHAMSVEREYATKKKQKKLPLMTHQKIEENYDVNFHDYIEKVMQVRNLLIKKHRFYKKKRQDLISQLKFTDKLKFRFEQYKRFSNLTENLFEKYPQIETYQLYKKLIEDLIELLFNTPLYTHTVHNPKEKEPYISQPSSFQDIYDEEPESINSILISYIKLYEKKNDFQFDEQEILNEIKELRDHMAKMWLYFKERHFRYALKKLNELTLLSLDDPDYNEKVKNNLRRLIPIISIYEIFHRPLSESVYPETKSQTRSQFTVALARFLTSKYNPFGFNILRLFNQLAFRNWAYLIKKKGMNYAQFFAFIVRLPIWKHIPQKIKLFMLRNIKNGNN